MVGGPSYPSTKPGDAEANEAAVITYDDIIFGPTERDVGAVRPHLQEIGYFHKVRGGPNPTPIVRLRNPILWARREKGPSRRKLPFAIADLGRIYDAIDWKGPDSAAIRCTISSDADPCYEWGYLGRGSQVNEFGKEITRRPLQMGEIEPLLEVCALIGQRRSVKYRSIFLFKD